MITVAAFLGAIALSTAIGATLFYHLGYRKGYSNGRHHQFCGVHMGDYCDCEPQFIRMPGEQRRRNA